MKHTSIGYTGLGPSAAVLLVLLLSIVAAPNAHADGTPAVQGVSNPAKAKKPKGKKGAAPLKKAEANAEPPLEVVRLEAHMRPTEESAQGLYARSLERTVQWRLVSRQQLEGNVGNVLADRDGRSAVSTGDTVEVKGGRFQAGQKVDLISVVQPLGEESDRWGAVGRKVAGGVVVRAGQSTEVLLTSSSQEIDTKTLVMPQKDATTWRIKPKPGSPGLEGTVLNALGLHKSAMPRSVVLLKLDKTSPGASGDVVDIVEPPPPPPEKTDSLERKPLDSAQTEEPRVLGRAVLLERVDQWALASVEEAGREIRLPKPFRPSP